MKFLFTTRKLNNLFYLSLLLILFFNQPQLSIAQCPGNNLITNPQPFQWTFHPVGPGNPEAYYSGTLEVGATTLNIGGETFTTRAYRQPGSNYSIPGPTIKMTPGNKYVLSFHNTLPYEPKESAHNVFKDPNVTNIHTHGLHISGESPADDVERFFEGGRGGDYVWDIPADHMGGTYWYHAHHHGATFLQVSGGLFGMLVIDDSNDGIPASVASMEERELVIGYVDPNASGTGGDVLLDGTLSPTWTVNGKVAGNMCVPPNTWQHWRILVADRDAMMKSVEFGPDCEIKLLARDGVWRTVAPKTMMNNSIGLTGASRADFAVRVTANSWIKVDGEIVANIYPDGVSDPQPHPYDVDGVSDWSANRPSYLRDLRNETNVNFESISMGARTVNGSKYDHMVPNLSLPATQVQEWSLSGARMHPFHLHVYHVQAQQTSGAYEAGEYYDVVSVSVDVRFDLNATTGSAFSGRTIMHCHILSHEDRGAMGWMNVTGGQGPPSYPIDSNLLVPFSDYYIIGGGTPQAPDAPSNLAASSSSSSSIDLSWTDNASNEDGFDIERSLDGSNFSLLASVNADITNYTDNGLNASTTYYYRVNAHNTVGNSAFSNIADATTSSNNGGGNATIFVQSITLSRLTQGGNRKRANAVVSIKDVNGNAVSGASVNASFTGPTSTNVSGITDNNGVVSFNSRATKNPSGEWCLEVTNVSLTGATYDQNSNIVNQACESGPVARMNTSAVVAAEGVKVFPNPLSSKTNISFYLSEKSDVLIEVYALTGTLMKVIRNEQLNKGNHVLECPVEELQSGTYLLHYTIGEHKKGVHKIMIIK